MPINNTQEVSLNIIIPIYNGEEYLNQTITSILSQTFKKFIVLFVDDGSTDSSPNIIKDFQKNDSRVRYLKISKSGAGQARNEGLQYFKNSYARYTLFLDADDIYANDMFYKLIQKAEDTSADITICSSLEIDSKDRVSKMYQSKKFKALLDNCSSFTPSSINQDIFTLCPGWTWDKLFKSEFIYSNKIKFQKLPIHNDVFFVFIALVLANKISCISNDLVIHRRQIKRSVSSINNRANNMESFLKAIAAIQIELKKRKLYALYEQSFLNWTINFTMWQFKEFNGKIEYQKELFYIVKQRILCIFDVSSYNKDFFYSYYNYKMFCSIIKRGFFSFYIRIKFYSLLVRIAKFIFVRFHYKRITNNSFLIDCKSRFK